MPKPKRFAAIDIGTVTCRMLIGDVVDGRVVPVVREYAITNLGEGVDASNQLLPAAIDRVAGTVARYVEKLCQFEVPGAGPIPLTAFATSAARDAENAEELVRALSTLGVTLSVIPGQQEAALSFSGASSEFPGEGIAVVDVGGGSTEVIVGEGGGEPIFSHSFNIGCRRVTERFLHSDPPSESEMRKAREWMAAEMAPYLAGFHAGNAANDSSGSSLPPFSEIAAPRMVAVAGTATSAVSIREAMEVYDSSRVHGSVVTRGQLEGITQRLAGMPLEQRMHVVGLDPDRAPVITAGMIILEEVMHALGVDEFTVSESDILQGIVLNASRENW